MEKITRIESIMNPDNWEPNFTKISEDTGLSTNALREWYKKQIDKGWIFKGKDYNSKIYIKNVSEAEAEARRKK